MPVYTLSASFTGDLFELLEHYSDLIRAVRCIHGAYPEMDPQLDGIISGLLFRLGEYLYDAVSTETYYELINRNCWCVTDNEGQHRNPITTIWPKRNLITGVLPASEFYFWDFVKAFGIDARRVNL